MLPTFTIFITIVIGLTSGCLFVCLPQIVVITTLFIFPTLKRLVPWEKKKPIRWQKNAKEHYDIQTRSYYDKKEKVTWLNVVLAYIWVESYEKIKKGWHNFLRGEILDLYKEIPGCFLEGIDLTQSSVGKMPKFSNVAVHDVDNKLQLTVDLSAQGNYTLTVNFHLYKFGTPVEILIWIKSLDGRLLLEFGTEPENTISFSLYDNFKSNVCVDTRINNQRYKWVNYILEKLVVQLLKNKFVLPRIKHLYLMNDETVILKGYVIFGSSKGTFTPFITRNLAFMILKPKVISLFETEYDDFPTCVIPVSSIDEVELSKPSPFNLRLGLGRTEEEIKIHCSCKNEINIADLILNSNSMTLDQLLNPNNNKTYAIDEDLAKDFGLEEIRRGRSYSNTNQKKSADDENSKSFFYSIIIHNSLDTKLWYDSIKRVDSNFKSSK